DGEVELVGGARAPEAHGVDGVVAEAGDRGVVGHAEHRSGVGPVHAEAAFSVADELGAAAELDLVRDLRARDLPRGSELQPLVGALDLRALPDDLVEDAELVAQAVAVAGVAERRHRVQVAGRQPPEAAAAEAGVDLLLQDVLELDVELRQRLARPLVEPEADEAVAAG